MARGHSRFVERYSSGRHQHTSTDPVADDYDDEGEEQDLTPQSSTSRSDDHDGDDRDHLGGNTTPDEFDEEIEDAQSPQEELPDEALEERLQRQLMEGESFERVVAMQKHMAEKAFRSGLRRREHEMVRAQKPREYGTRDTKSFEDEDLDVGHHWAHESRQERIKFRSLLAQILSALCVFFGIISVNVLLWNSKYGDTVEAARIVPADNILGLDSVTHWSFDNHEVARTSAAIESIYDDANAIFKQIDLDKEWLKHESLYRPSREYVVDIDVAREQPSILQEMNADFVSGQKEWLDYLTAELDKKVQRYSSNPWATAFWDFWMTVSPIPGSYSLTSTSSIARLMQKHVRVQEALLTELETRTNDLDAFLQAAKIRRQALRTPIDAELEKWEHECKAKQIYPVVPAGSEKDDARSPCCKWARPDVVASMLSEMRVMRDFRVAEDFVGGNKGRYEEVGMALRQTDGAASGVRRDRAYKSMGHPRQAGYVAWMRGRVRAEGERVRMVGKGGGRLWRRELGYGLQRER